MYPWSKIPSIRHVRSPSAIQGFLLQEKPIHTELEGIKMVKTENSEYVELNKNSAVWISERVFNITKLPTYISTINSKPFIHGQCESILKQK